MTNLNSRPETVSRAEVVSSGADLTDGVALDVMGPADLSEGMELLLRFTGGPSKNGRVISIEDSGARAVIEANGRRWWLHRRDVVHFGPARHSWAVGGREMRMSPQEIFARAGQFLFGSGHDWKSQYGAALMIKPDTIDAMAKGKSRIPPGLWNEIAALLQDRGNELPALRSMVLEQVPQEADFPTAIGYPQNSTALAGAAPRWTEADRALLQSRFNTFTDNAGLRRGAIQTDGARFGITIPGRLRSDQVHALEQWLEVETVQLGAEKSYRAPKVRR